MRDGTKATIEGYVKLAMDIFTQVESMKVELSDDEAAYDLRYIGQAMTKCSTIMEKISDKQLSLTRMELELRKYQYQAKLVLRDKERAAKESKAYKDLPKELRNDWITPHLLVYKEEGEAWDELMQVLHQVKEAVSDRMQLVKRLDSDVRLHQKLYEVKVAAGMVPRKPLSGTKAPEQLI